MQQRSQKDEGSIMNESEKRLLKAIFEDKVDNTYYNKYHQEKHPRNRAGKPVSCLYKRRIIDVKHQIVTVIGKHINDGIYYIYYNYR